MLVERIEAANKAKYGPKATISQLESAVGIGNGLIKKWEKSSPKIENILKIAEYLDVSIDYLCGRTERKELPASGSSEREKDLFALFSRLNDEGRGKLIDYADDLVRSGKYEKDASVAS